MEKEVIALINVQTIVLGDISTNTYIVTDEESGECVVIDPATESEQLLNLLKDKKIKYILLTHGHFDHITGAKAVKELTGGKIAVHTNDSLCLKSEDESLFSWQYPGGVQPKTDADILLNDGDELYLGKEKIKVMHTPGHTVGGVCYIFESSRIIFSGDTLFHMSAGRTDFPGGNPREELMSLSRLASLNGDYKVYAGHGESTTLQYERDNNRYVRIR